MSLSRLVPRLVVLALFSTLLAASPAGAHGVTATIIRPSVPPPANFGFGIVFRGDVTALQGGVGLIWAKSRLAPGPCAVTPAGDPGGFVSFGNRVSTAVRGRFDVTGSFVANLPGTYVVCAWIQDAINAFGPPSAGTVEVRAGTLDLSITAPASIPQYTPFLITATYRSEVGAVLDIYLAQAPECSSSSEALRTTSAAPPRQIASQVRVLGVGSQQFEATINDAGRYLICGYATERDSRLTTTALKVAPAAIVDVAPALLPGATYRCGYVGGRKNIRDVRATNITCSAARGLARRWARYRRPPRRVGSYRCLAQSGQVQCAGASPHDFVEFSFGRPRR